MSGRFLRNVLHRSVRRAPAVSAVSVAGEDLTYRELWHRAGALGRKIDHDLGAPARVGVLTSRTVETYVAYWALVRLGCSVVPLNPSMPAPRLAAALQDAEVGVLLHTEHHVGLARELGIRCAGLVLQQVDPSTEGAELPAPTAETGHPGNEAYAIFTSGSTGAPKGVPITDDNLRSWLPHVVRTYATTEPMRVAQTADIAWDLSVFNMWLAWSAGGTLVDPGHEVLVMPASFIAEARLTHWFSTPQSITMADLLGDLRPGAMDGLRWSLFGGELLRHDQTRRWMRAASGSRLANVYGPTELTCTCFDYIAPHDPADWLVDQRGVLPVGRPHPAVDHALIPVDAAVNRGELVVRGSQRFAGYVASRDDHGAFVRGGDREIWGTVDRPESSDWYRTGDLVEQRVDEHGRAVLYVVGRTDDQVKIDGHRVEPQEIEHCARTCAEVDDIAVVAHTVGETTELTAFVVGNVRADVLLAHLRARLPDHMIPARTQRLTVLPQNVNGKVDRRRLRELARA
ncbi:AMP-binding protein [Nocardia sp. CNY236]|uniref:AMP-binding protein n=1 Tax=Nocardia sp. CNY236 TaxID=1169152 RepID=UPI0004108580|nr:AMP-binding protein [Nocardia sp. CNY236]